MVPGIPLRLAPEPGMAALPPLLGENGGLGSQLTGEQPEGAPQTFIKEIAGIQRTSSLHLGAGARPRPCLTQPIGDDVATVKFLLHFKQMLGFPGR